MTFTATGRLTAHTKCRNEVEDLERSVELCGRAVADNKDKAGNFKGHAYDSATLPRKRFRVDVLTESGYRLAQPLRKEQKDHCELNLGD